MNYSAHYDHLIARARGRVLTSYLERHHIIPRCMGGGNEPENIVELTAEEHYVAHQLLVKMYSDQPGLAYAAMKMAKKATGNRAYGWLRRRSAQSSVGNKHGKANAGKKKPPRTESHQAKMTAALRGLTRSSETKTRISAARRGTKRKPFSAEWRAKLSAAGIGRKLSTENREKLRAVWIGRKHTAESISKMSASHRARRAMSRKEAADARTI